MNWIKNDSKKKHNEMIIIIIWNNWYIVHEAAYRTIEDDLMMTTSLLKHFVLSSWVNDIQYYSIMTFIHLKKIKINNTKLRIKFIPFLGIKKIMYEYFAYFV
jgi:hypothetical protein